MNKTAPSENEKKNRRRRKQQERQELAFTMFHTYYFVVILCVDTLELSSGGNEIIRSCYSVFSVVPQHIYHCCCWAFVLFLFLLCKVLCTKWIVRSLSCSIVSVFTSLQFLLSVARIHTKTNLHYNGDPGLTCRIQATTAYTNYQKNHPFSQNTSKHTYTQTQDQTTHRDT